MPTHDEPKADIPLAPPRNHYQWSRRGLAWKLFAYTFPVIVLIVSLTQVGVATLNYRQQLRAHLARAKITASLTAEALSKPVWNIDRSVIESQIKAIEQDENFRYARLLDENGDVLMELGRRPESSQVVVVQEPIMEPGGKNQIGRFLLVMSTEELRSGGLLSSRNRAGGHCHSSGRLHYHSAHHPGPPGQNPLATPASSHGQSRTKSLDQSGLERR